MIARDSQGAETGVADEDVARLRDRANWIRRTALRMIRRAGQGHPGGDLSAADILAVLYFGVLRHDPNDPADSLRDRFVMSKGHCTGALYAALAGAGYIPERELDSYLQPNSPLNGHPNRKYVRGVEANTGPLGHGLPVAVGMAIAGQIDRAPFRVYVLTGDGELQEGGNWEAAMLAGHRRLDKLTVIVDRNRLQQGAPTESTNALEPLADKWAAFGWDVTQVDGHDHRALMRVLAQPSGPREKPLAVIASTVKGQGVSFMQDQVQWHHGVPNDEQFAAAMLELGEEVRA